MDADVLDLTPLELLTTTRTVRKRLDLDRPVDRGLLERCLAIAFQAPNGSNQQLYDFVVVDDPDTRAEMAAIYRRGLADHLALDPGTRSAPTVDDRQAQIGASVQHLVEHLHQVPVLVVATVAGRMEGASTFDQASRWASVQPTIWNLMLALRLHGLGSAWTTLHLHREVEMAELLGIPHAEVTQAGLFPVAHTIGTDFRPASRRLARECTHWGRW
jgi:nitroreductase